MVHFSLKLLLGVKNYAVGKKLFDNNESGFFFVRKNSNECKEKSLWSVIILFVALKLGVMED